MYDEKILLVRFRGIVEAEFRREYQWIIDAYMDRTEAYSYSAYLEDYLALCKCCEKYQCSATTLYRLDFLSTCGYDDAYVHVQNVHLDYVRKLCEFIGSRHPGIFDISDK